MHYSESSLCLCLLGISPGRHAISGHVHFDGDNFFHGKFNNEFLNLLGLKYFLLSLSMNCFIFSGLMFLRVYNIKSLSAMGPMNLFKIFG